LHQLTGSGFGWRSASSAAIKCQTSNHPAERVPAPTISYTIITCRFPLSVSNRDRGPSVLGLHIRTAIRRVLLARPRETHVAAEKVSSFSGLKTASDYFGPITELATAKGFSVLNEPHDFVVGTKHLVRGDFS